VLEGVIFDLDGVLVLTADLHARIWADFIARQPHPELREYRRRPGRRGADVIRQLVPTMQPATLDRYIASMRAQFRHEVEAGNVPLAPGVGELLRSLHERCRVGIATSSDRETVEQLLGSLTEYVHEIVTSDDCSMGKPHPEPYNRAVDRLGLEAANALAIEDTPVGIASARQAGLRVWAVGTSLRSGELLAAGADYVFPDLSAVSSGLLRLRAHAGN
jgi:HAD superfamily hydrolase (TIGR01509 family)